MTSKDFRSVSMPIGLGNFLDIHQHLRMGAAQGHSNRTVNPYELHHALTFEESCCLGWIFHVTSADNRQSIQEEEKVVQEEIRFISCTTTTTPMDTSEWQMAPRFQEPTEIQFTVSWCLRQPLSFNCFFRRME